MDLKLDTSVPWSSLVDEVKRVIVSWFAIISKGRKAFLGIDFENDNTLLFSIRFMIYMGIISFSLEFPMLSVFGARANNYVFIMATLIFLYVGWFSQAAILHVLFKLRGGPRKSGSRIRCKIRQTTRRSHRNEQDKKEQVLGGV